MKKIIPITVEAVDTLLPQTQCGDCDYDGCKPYAEAIVNHNERINKCPPGGVDGLKRLADLTGQTLSDEMIADMRAQEKPEQVAFIREEICIGCKKCIEACPVDAILGGPKLMHTVITDECNGCELCLPPCPMDCIDLIEISRELKPDHYRMRYEARNERIDQRKKAQREKQLNARKKSAASYLSAALKKPE